MLGYLNDVFSLHDWNLLNWLAEESSQQSNTPTDAWHRRLLSQLECPEVTSVVRLFIRGKRMEDGRSCLFVLPILSHFVMTGRILTVLTVLTVLTGTSNLSLTSSRHASNDIFPSLPLYSLLRLSTKQISRKQMDLKKKLKVTFVGEPGLDMGGLTKEWFLLLIKEIFSQNYGW